MKISYAVLKDKEKVMKLVKGLYSRGSPKSVKDWEKNYCKYSKNTFVVKENKKIIAYLMFMKYKNLIYICDLYVLPKYRKRGIAFSLLKRVEKISKVKKKKLQVGVRGRDYKAKKLYKKFGFKFKEKKLKRKNSEIWEK